MEGRRPGPRSRRAAACSSSPPPGRSRAGGRTGEGKRQPPARPGAGLRGWGAKAPVPAGPITSFPAFLGIRGGDAPQPRPQDRACRPEGRRGGCPLPHCSVGRCGGGAVSPQPRRTLPGGAGPGSGAAEAAGPPRQEERLGRAGCASGARLSEPRADSRGQGGREELAPGRIGEARQTSAQAAPGPRSCGGQQKPRPPRPRRGRAGSENPAGRGTPPRLPPPGTGSGCAARLGEGRSGPSREPLAGRLGALCSERLRLLCRPAGPRG